MEIEQCIVSQSFAGMFEIVVSAAECNNETAEGHRFALLPNISIRLDCQE
jgi:hypothetical protein